MGIEKKLMRISFGLFLLFIYLKVANFIDWSWFWVSSPIWILLLFFGILFCLIVFVISNGQNFIDIKIEKKEET